MTPKRTIAGLSATAIIMGGVDAANLREIPIERVENIGIERVEARQIDNEVVTSFSWRGENDLKVKVDLGEPTLTERLVDRRKKEVITETVDFDDGGFKVDILLNEKPDTNIFCYAIEGAENYDFFYQPPLTDEEIADGAERTEDIVGSYAVYHKTLKNNNYQTGKVMHIPRPQVWELGNEEATKEWAELSYTERDGLCVTVRQEFLDNANYPVRVDPTFGYTSVGASYAIGGYNLTSFFATTTTWGTFDSVSYILTAAGFGNTDASASTTVGVYYASSTTDINELASGSNVQGNAITASTTIWLTQDLTTEVSFEADEYFQIGVLYETPGENYVPYDIVSGYSATLENPYVAGAPTLPDPFPSASFSGARPSIYVSYTSTTTPTVTTNAASSVSTSTATLNGEITDDGGASSTIRGFAWGTNSGLSGGDTATTTETGTFGVAAFTSNLTSLIPNTTYYFRAYAVNESGTSTGSILNFKTAEPKGSQVYINKGTVKVENGKIIID